MEPYNKEIEYKKKIIRKYHYDYTIYGQGQRICV